MSLINDALKRASQAQKETPATPVRPASSPEPLLRPVESRPPPSSTTPLLLGVILLVCLLGAAVAGWAWLRNSRKTETAAAPAASAPAVAVATPAVVVPVVPVPVKPAPAPVQATTTVVAAPTPAPVLAAPATLVATAEAVPAPMVTAPITPAFPAVKLQGIFYSPTKPICILNGKNCSVGTKVSGVEVVKIEAEAVTVRFGAETKVLEISP